MRPAAFVLPALLPCLPLLSSAKEDRFDPVASALHSAVDSGEVAGGALILWQRGRTLVETGFGFADRETQALFRVDTPVVIASISKPVLGTALYRLVETGKLEPGAPITRYLPAFESATLESGAALIRPPTVTELLTHSSGLRADDDRLGRIWFQSWTQGQTLEVIIDRIAREFPFRSQPGSGFAYSGIGTDVAARIGEVVSGLPRNELLIEELGRPLGMESTFYRAADGLERLDRAMPTRYHRDKASGRLAASRIRVVPPPNRYASSGGAIVSTAPDLLRWLLVFRNHGRHQGEAYLHPETVEAMLTPHDVGNRTRCGFSIRERSEDGRPTLIGHSGSSGTDVWIDLEHDAIAILLTQTKGSDIQPFMKTLRERIQMVFESPARP